jgi:hypothetical protein
MKRREREMREHEENIKRQQLEAQAANQLEEQKRQAQLQ